MVANPPHEIATVARTLGLRHLHKTARGEWSSECPACGGHLHSSGELPDRLTIWERSRATGSVLAWCRKCNYSYNPEREGDPVAVDEETLAKLARIAKEQERAFLTQQEHKLQAARTAREWETYHATALADQAHLTWWRTQGISLPWVQKWRLGYVADKTYSLGGELHTSPAYTIPKFDLTGQLMNIDFRLVFIWFLYKCNTHKSKLKNYIKKMV